MENECYSSFNALGSYATVVHDESLRAKKSGGRRIKNPLFTLLVDEQVHIIVDI